MNPISLKAELRQQLKLTPKLMQSMAVLQMNSQELLDYLDRMAEENPVLEREEPSGLREAYEELRQRAVWLDAAVPGFSAGGDPPDRGAADRETESLAAFLRDQLERRRLDRPLLVLAEYLAELVDEDGYLAEEDLEGVRDLGLPPELIQGALTQIQSLDPPGVGARSLSECLLLQLERRGGADPALEEIVRRFLPELGRKHYGPIAKALGLSLQEVREAETVISALEPHPGRAFQAAEPAVYVRPDLFVAEGEDGELQVVLNEYYLPKITVSGYYARLMKECGDEKTQVYLREKLQQAKWLMDSLDRRGVTLRRCGQAILEAQRPFFLGQTGALAPMDRQSLAGELGLHVSTVSRAVGGKYLQCRQGTYPLSYFFNRRLGEDGPSRQAVKRQILELVASEDPRRPLSDQRLCDALAAEGVQISRRTVAKYRMELRLGSAAARRR